MGGERQQAMAMFGLKVWVSTERAFLFLWEWCHATTIVTRNQGAKICREFHSLSSAQVAQRAGREIQEKSANTTHKIKESSSSDISPLPEIFQTFLCCNLSIDANLSRIEVRWTPKELHQRQHSVLVRVLYSHRIASCYQGLLPGLGARWHPRSAVQPHPSSGKTRCF
jgi:hypothetical protein